MTLAELKLNDLTKIYGKYYYLNGEGVYNIFYVSFINGTEAEFEPCSLKEMLIDLSDKVEFGNNFSEVANCLKLPSYMMTDAENLDKVMMYTFS